VDHARFFIELGAILIAAIALPFLAMVILRGRRIPECFSCGARKVRPSQVAGFWDLVGLAFLIRPFRCSGCRERFHAFFPSVRRSPEAQPQRIIKVIFRFRSGLPVRIAIRVVYPGNRLPETLPNSPAVAQIL
jgi:hypothetical protein